MKFFVSLENQGNTEEGIILGQKRCFQALKGFFFNFARIQGGVNIESR